VEVERAIYQKMHTEVATKVLAKSKLDAVMEDMCSICFEVHIMRDTICTECHHHFGKACFQQWVQKCYSENKDVYCPLCKKVSPTYFAYREKAKNK